MCCWQAEKTIIGTLMAIETICTLDWFHTVHLIMVSLSLVCHVSTVCTSPCHSCVAALWVKVSLVCIFVPPLGSPRESPMTFAAIRRDQRVLETNEYTNVPARGTEARVSPCPVVGKECQVALVYVWCIAEYIMANMGISTLRSCKGAQFADASGLNRHVVYTCLDGVSSQIESVNFEQMACSHAVQQPSEGLFHPWSA